MSQSLQIFHSSECSMQYRTTVPPVSNRSPSWSLSAISLNIADRNKAVQLQHPHPRKQRPRPRHHAGQACTANGSVAHRQPASHHQTFSRGRIPRHLVAARCQHTQSKAALWSHDQEPTEQLPAKEATHRMAPWIEDHDKNCSMPAHTVHHWDAASCGHTMLSLQDAAAKGFGGVETGSGTYFLFLWSCDLEPKKSAIITWFIAIIHIIHYQCNPKTQKPMTHGNFSIRGILLFTFYSNNPSIIMDHNEWYHILIGWQVIWPNVGGTINRVWCNKEDLVTQQKELSVTVVTRIRSHFWCPSIWIATSLIMNCSIIICSNNV